MFCDVKVMRATYKTVKGLASVDFANMARQLAAELKVWASFTCHSVSLQFLAVCVGSVFPLFHYRSEIQHYYIYVYVPDIVHVWLMFISFFFH